MLCGFVPTSPAVTVTVVQLELGGFDPLFGERVQGLPLKLSLVSDEVNETVPAGAEAPAPFVSVTVTVNVAVPPTDAVAVVGVIIVAVVRVVTVSVAVLLVVPVPPLAELIVPVVLL